MADMFSKATAYEYLMGCWSDRLALLFCNFRASVTESRFSTLGAEPGRSAGW
jgi:hypothetical protein